MSSTISFVLDNKIKKLDLSGISPTTTVLNYLRNDPFHKGVKEGCAEGDCGACTVVIGELQDDNSIMYHAIDSCLVFLPQLDGKQLITIENLSKQNASGNELHPVQQAMVDTNGSQCGYCTPGIVMSLFALYKKNEDADRAAVEDALTGNLCRCTGYKPIIDAALQTCVKNTHDHFSDEEKEIVKMLQQIKNERSDKLFATGTQTYYKPLSLDHALKLKSDFPEATVITGSSDIALRVTKKHETIASIIDIASVGELKKHIATTYSHTFGSALSLEKVKSLAQKTFPALYDTLAVFGSRQIRNVASFGGNLGSASPIGDTIPILMAYQAAVHLQSVSGSRTVDISNFITGYRQTVRKADELITAVSIPVPDNDSIVKWYKVSKRKDLDISTVSGGFRLKLNNNKVDEIVLAFGGMAAMVRRAENTEKFLLGKEWSRDVVEDAMEILYNEFQPISDARAIAEFRKLAARNLLLKFWSETVQITSFNLSIQ